MSSISISTNTATQPRVASRARQGSASRLGFWLFVLVNFLLLVRPGELFPAIGYAHLYELSILGCIVLYFPNMLSRLAWKNLRNNPITICVVGLLPVTALSSSWAGRSDMYAEYTLEYLKVVIYYLILVCALDAPARVRQFMIVLCPIIALVGGIALANHYDIIQVDSIQVLMDSGSDDEGKNIKFERLQGIGIFGDPNDLAQILAVGVILCVYGMDLAKKHALRLLWGIPITIMLWAIYLTKSRGGLMALMAGLAMLFVGRFGWKKAVLVAALIIPVLLVVFGGRQTAISTKEASAQSRVQLWSDALLALRENPGIGLSPGVFNETAGQVAHNSFLQAFAETGFIGGLLFSTAYFVAIWGMARLRLKGMRVLDPDLAKVTPILAAAVVCYFVGMLSLTRNYVIPTYTMLGLVAAYLTIVRTYPEKSHLRWGLSLLGKSFAVAVGYLVAMQIFVRAFVSWG